MVPAAQVDAFKKEMAAARVNTQIFSYPGATHAFTNPEATELGKKHNLPVAYNAEADAQSWSELTKFLSALYPSK
jgi:dienelactone hydrolase